MKIFFTALAVVYGLFWLVFGLNGFLHFFPVSAPSGRAAEFMQALERAGYAMPAVYGLQMATGAMLLTGRFVPFALALLAPVIANILLYDLFLNQSGLVTGCIITVLYCVLLFRHRHEFIPLLKP